MGFKRLYSGGGGWGDLYTEFMVIEMFLKNKKESI